MSRSSGWSINESAVQRFLSKIEKTNNCWLWTGQRNKKGYGRLKVGLRPVEASRFSYRYFCGEIPDGYFVCHKCDNPPCVRPDHLFVGTALDNARDMRAKGRAARLDRVGSKNWSAKISEHTASEIKVLLNSGVPIAEISRKLQVGKSLISTIKNGQCWRHIEPAISLPADVRKKTLARSKAWEKRRANALQAGGLTHA